LGSSSIWPASPAGRIGHNHAMTAGPSTIDDAYAAAIARLTPAEKIARSMAMLDWSRRWMGRQIVAESGPLPDRRLRWEVALRLYGSEPATCRLIETAIAAMGHDVPG
jgi:hypothetical protein